MNAAPAPGVFHSAASQASAAADEQHREHDAPTRQWHRRGDRQRRGRQLDGERGAGVSGQGEVRLATDDRDRDRGGGNERAGRQRPMKRGAIGGGRHRGDSGSRSGARP